ncbi:hypothetical protein SEA_TORTELLINI_53 [Mycobacterium phage Tortellini]|uniref:Uncharacterized protein n=1 Tax=Mycobacterium phage Tortellini TaxID=1897497 RepID=A0A1D8EX51_9CAUD|nr:hypothetical protein FDH05_gp53 [Mycobacterium phage Tortellini]AOT25798.1 hypothetical protein SEA_TORTELLINI_53 [Mycobacterium phage Tortellini]
MMRYEYDTEEWAAAMYGMSEVERASVTPTHTRPAGMLGDRDDARDEMGDRW